MTEVGHVKDEWLTIDELAGELKISPRTIRNRRSLGKLPVQGYKVLGLVRFKRSEVNRWLESSADGGGEAA